MSKKNNQNTKNQQPIKENHITSKQVVAIIGIVFLVLLYLVTLVVAFVDNSSSGKLFGLCLFATMAVPLLIWVYTWMYGKLTNKHTFADFDIENKDL